CTSLLMRWEDEHLLDAPTPELLAAHKETVERLLRFGAFLAMVTERNEIGDKQLKATVAAAQNCLRDKLTLWHSPNLNEQRGAEILKRCFNEPRAGAAP